jgi:isocitrate/isopropylmalate dehydrogenase
VTARQCERISRVAFDAATKRRRKVTAVHKANVLHLSDGLFLREVRKVARQYPNVELDEKIVDAMAALLVRDPSRFDCIVTGNMFGDILSDEASEISGGLGLAGSVMAGDDACCAQAQHGSAPDIAGKDIANPTALILSAAMLLEWLAARHLRPELDEAARTIESAIDGALQSPQTRTRDLGGVLGTDAFARHIVERID